MKTCFHCRIPKQFSDFQRDRTKKDGYRSTCTICLKARREAKKLSKLSPISSLHPGIFRRISEKHKAFFTIAVEQTGKCQLQIFSQPVMILKGENVEELLEKAI